MEWTGLVCWTLVLLMAAPVAAAALTAPPLGLAPPLATGGLALCVLYLAIPHHPWLAWASAGVAVAAALAVGSGAATLISDAPRAVRAGQAIEEHAAALAGALVPLLLTVGFLMALAAVGVTTVA